MSVNSSLIYQGGMLANALNGSPGEYSRKAETQTNWRGGAQPVEHVVQFDTKR